MRIHVIAWGHPTKPDLDFVTDEYDPATTYEYQCVSTAIMEWVSVSALEAALDAIEPSTAEGK